MNTWRGNFNDCPPPIRIRYEEILYEPMLPDSLRPSEDSRRFFEKLGLCFPVLTLVEQICTPRMALPWPTPHRLWKDAKWGLLFVLASFLKVVNWLLVPKAFKRIHGDHDHSLYHSTDFTFRNISIWVLIKSSFTSASTGGLPSFEERRLQWWVPCHICHDRP